MNKNTGNRVIQPCYQETGAWLIMLYVRIVNKHCSQSGCSAASQVCLEMPDIVNGLGDRDIAVDASSIASIAIAPGPEANKDEHKEFDAGRHEF